MIVLLVDLQMLGEVANALGKYRDLHRSAALVGFRFAEFLDELGRLLLRDTVFRCHFPILSWLPSSSLFRETMAAFRRIQGKGEHSSKRAVNATYLL